MSFWDFLFGGQRRSNTNTTMSKQITYPIYNYRTEDGVAYFKFSYHWAGSGFEIDIHQSPNYEGRIENSETAHWLTGNRDAPRKICITENKLPKTLEAAQKLSMAYAEYTWEYIKTGVTIDAQIAIESQN